MTKNNNYSRRFKDLVGQKFGRLTVVAQAPHQGKLITWFCKCDCKEDIFAVRSENLSKGRVKSCGCLKVDVSKTRNLTHGHSRRNQRTKTYDTWAGMFKRCYNPKTKGYEYYGGQGVKVCERWHNFVNFLEDMGERPEGLSIDRYPDRDGDYEPGNCRWATNIEQRNNQRMKVYSDPRYKYAIEKQNKIWNWTDKAALEKDEGDDDN